MFLEKISPNTTSIGVLPNDNRQLKTKVRKNTLCGKSFLQNVSMKIVSRGVHRDVDRKMKLKIGTILFKRLFLYNKILNTISKRVQTTNFEKNIKFEKIL